MKTRICMCIHTLLKTITDSMSFAKWATSIWDFFPQLYLQASQQYMSGCRRLPSGLCKHEYLLESKPIS